MEQQYILQFGKRKVRGSRAEIVEALVRFGVERAEAEQAADRANPTPVPVTPTHNHDVTVKMLAPLSVEDTGRLTRLLDEIGVPYSIAADATPGRP